MDLVDLDGVGCLFGFRKGVDGGLQFERKAFNLRVGRDGRFAKVRQDRAFQSGIVGDMVDHRDGLAAKEVDAGFQAVKE